MNGISCNLNFDDVKQLIIEAVAKRLDPERILGPCKGHAVIADDGRVEVTFAPSPDAAAEASGDGKDQAAAEAVSQS
jgi:hypothetical protein